MTSYHLVRPTSVPDAIDLLASAPLPFDSPSNHRLHDRAVLGRAFSGGRRRPELVWATRADDRVLATVAALCLGDAIVLDVWGGDPGRLDLALAAATGAARGLPGSEACLHLPPGAGPSDPAVSAWLDALAAQGWRLLVQRHHHETATSALSIPTPAPGLRLEHLTGPDDPRLRPLFRGILDGSLDAHDAELVARAGMDDAVERAVSDLLDADPWQCIRLAFDGDGPGPVGMVSWVCTPEGRGYVNHIGVAAPFRGRGHGRQVLARAMRELAAEGATVLVADTDAGNHPMAAAFARLGWGPTETRLDLVPA